MADSARPLRRPAAVLRDKGSEAARHVPAWMQRVRDLAVSAASGLVRRWRTSLQFRVVTTTMLLGLLVVSLLGAYLFREISNGLVEDRVARAQAEALDLTKAAQTTFDSLPASDAGKLSVDAYTTAMKAAPPAGDESRFVILTRSRSNTSPTVLANVSSGRIGPAAIPEDLASAVSADPARQQTKVTSVDLGPGGGVVPAVIVGSQVQVPLAGPYDLYFVYPMQREEQTLGLITRSFAVGGFALVLLVGAVAWMVTRQVVHPVRRAAVVARRLASGQLNERMSSRGEDDLALLARSFNDMADNLQTQIRQLEGLSRVQQRFVSDVSHELRTPLTTIRMAGDLIFDARDGFDPTVSRSAELLHNELDRFEELLSDLLEISRFDAGAAALDVEAIDLRDTAARVVESAHALADSKRTVLTIHAPNRACVADIDPRRVERILRNLVVNAIEHSEGRPVDIHVAQNDSAVAILVRDQGVGLRPGEASLVFNRFWRADPARARSTGGTGLGLAIALEDARLHHGWLQAWGQPGVGSRFRLTLPKRPDEPIDVAPLPLTPEAGRP
jgi:two-component system, OmpR family, sensor histidine kinase MtrB